MSRMSVAKSARSDKLLGSRSAPTAASLSNPTESSPTGGAPPDLSHLPATTEADLLSEPADPAALPAPADLNAVAAAATADASQPRHPPDAVLLASPGDSPRSFLPPLESRKFSPQESNSPHPPALKHAKPLSSHEDDNKPMTRAQAYPNTSSLLPSQDSPEDRPYPSRRTRQAAAAAGASLSDRARSLNRETEAEMFPLKRRRAEEASEGTRSVDSTTPEASTNGAADAESVANGDSSLANSETAISGSRPEKRTKITRSTARLAALDARSFIPEPAQSDPEPTASSKAKQLGSIKTEPDVSKSTDRPALYSSAHQDAHESSVAKDTKDTKPTPRSDGPETRSAGSAGSAVTAAHISSAAEGLPPTVAVGDAASPAAPQLDDDEGDVVDLEDDLLGSLNLQQVQAAEGDALDRAKAEMEKISADIDAWSKFYFDLINQDILLEQSVLEDETHTEFKIQCERIQSQRDSKLERAESRLRLAEEQAQTMVDAAVRLAHQTYNDGARKIRKDIMESTSSTIWGLRSEYEMSSYTRPSGHGFVYGPLTLFKKKKAAIESAGRTSSGLPEGVQSIPDWARAMMRKRKQLGLKPVATPSFCDGLNENEKEEDLMFIRLLTGGVV
ncbi:uncharacterized protein BJ171DRAFT_495304 [Polychytrium aggregatum]|uniref:uncharacterized protein n=1 Tax=Polychytrium aggregatum TaxID=110093 RepID=UPI0022FE3A2D|nr:uncharacterized protein BJ171DRAFT_495304 [Polychytrium aggregatum]KAI9206968.1 hypothetical protein BJ171DRAFT_495304 [Polychytrium aggregatum]